ncbi:aTP-dependent DNA helicase RecQ-like [Ruminococcus sp. CAG:177]|nr:aTP-dependent DNA helicase RecQ-like [Ruminococcus sp. CAG:177]
MRDKLSVLKEYFGHDSFREGQGRITDSLLGGRDVLGIMPTGAGKSICYQVPALMFDGITIVVSPLISLMKDQVSALVQSGVAAAYINSSLTHAQYLKVLQNIKSGKYKIIYVAPERLCAPAFLGICRNLNISMVAVDEAHCVSQWGQDFRPSYLKIPDFIDALNSRPVVGAFTATATGAVRDDIKTLLRLVSPLVVTTGFDRPNLFFSVMQPKNKSIELMKLIKERKNESGIVYCSTRKAVEEVCELLQKNGFAATRYHAGLDENERRRNQDDFVYDRATIMVATNAFGMGIDKSNVSFVIHYNMPKNMESYYQEAGRAGRDGRSADCILLYSAKDVRTNQFLINNSEPNPDLTEDEQEEVRRRDRERLKQMTFYCTTHKCLRKFILEYFGDKGPERCEKCSNCLSNHENTDITVDAQKIMSCVARTGQRYGKKVICDVLRGSKNERLISAGLSRQSTYGIMADCPEKRLRDIIDHLCENGYMTAQGDEYPILKLAPKSRGVLTGQETLRMMLEIPQKKKAAAAKDAPLSPADEKLLAALKDLRKSLAMRQSIPAYVVFTDATLIDMCRLKPKTQEEFMEVSGVGQAKSQRYGEVFLTVIAEFSE